MLNHNVDVDHNQMSNIYSICMLFLLRGGSTFMDSCSLLCLAILYSTCLKSTYSGLTGVQMFMENYYLGVFFLCQRTRSSMIQNWQDQSVAYSQGRMSKRLSSQLSGSQWKVGGRVAVLCLLLPQCVKNRFIFSPSSSTLGYISVYTMRSNIDTGPNRYIFRSLPKMHSQAQVSPMSSSSVCAISPSFRGRSSALGVAFRTYWITLKLWTSQKQVRIYLSLNLEKEPMGLMSAELLSYLVKQPRRDSSRLDDPSTSRNPYSLEIYTSREARKQVSTILVLDWMFCRARSVLQDPPSFLNFGQSPSYLCDIYWQERQISSKFTALWLHPNCSDIFLARPFVQVLEFSVERQAVNSIFLHISAGLCGTQFFYLRTFLSYLRIYSDCVVLVIWLQMRKHILQTMSATVQLSRPPESGRKKPLALDFLRTSQRKTEGSQLACQNSQSARFLFSYIL